MISQKFPVESLYKIHRELKTIRDRFAMAGNVKRISAGHKASIVLDVCAWEQDATVLRLYQAKGGNENFTVNLLFFIYYSILYVTRFTIVNALTGLICDDTKDMTASVSGYRTDIYAENIPGIGLSCSVAVTMDVTVECRNADY